MKRFSIALLIGMIVLASAGVAAAEVTVGGDIELRYDLWDNLALGNAPNLVQGATSSKTQSFFADRILLNVDAKITEGLEAYVEMQTANNGASQRVWGGPSTNVYGSEVVSADNFEGESMAIRQAWVNFMIPGIPVGVKIGHQPLALGHGIFIDTQRDGSDAILVYSKPLPNLLIAAVYNKVATTSSSIPGVPATVYVNSHHDVDAYAGLANFTFIPNNTVGVFYAWAHDPLTHPLGADVARLQDFGAIADGTIGPLSYKAEVDYQNINADVVTAAGGDTTIGVQNAWAGMAGASANIVNLVNIGGEAAYGTGTNPNQANTGKGAFSDPIARTYATPYGLTSYNYAFL
ncbi:MAG: hypothetical protein ABSG42_08145, partial [Nitrospirota bacterium]